MANSFFAELKRRNVLRVALGYVALAWLLIQVVETLFPVFGVSDANIRLVVIVLGIGFIPALILAWVFEFTAQGVMTDTEAAAAGESTGAEKSSIATRAKSFDRIVLVVLALAVTLFAFDKFVLAPEREQVLVDAASQQIATPSSAIRNRSVAVLPFVNMSGDPQNEYFSDGLTETLLHMLTQLPDLLVSARTSSFAFKGQNVDIREIALALGVAHILEGSVQKVRNRVRVTAQLIRADDGFHIWSQNYDRTLDDIFAIQDEIAGDVASALGSSLLTADAGNIKGVRTSDISAFDIYLQGLEQQAINSNDSLIAAAGLFEDALQQDPGFTDAAIALVRNHLFLQWKMGNLSPYTLDDTAALLAEILEGESDHLAAQGLSLWVQLIQAEKRVDLHAVDDLIEQMIDQLARGFGDSYVRRHIVRILGGRGRKDEALAILREGLTADPLNYDLLWAQATLFAQQGRHQDALQPLLTARKLAPDNAQVLWKLGMNSFDAGEVVQGLDWVRQAARLDPSDPALPEILSRRLYELGLVQAGDYWRQTSLQIDPDRFALRLEMNNAIARNDDEDLLQAAKQIIDTTLETGQGPMVMGAWNYAKVMHERGQSRQALDYLISKNPRMSEATWVPNEWQLFMLKSYSLTLWADVMSHADFTEFASVYLDAMEVANVRLGDSRIVEIVTALWRDDVDLAKTIFLEKLRDYPMDQVQWDVIVDHPSMTEFVRDPDVAARLAEAEVARVGVRNEVQQMLLRPEWQFGTDHTGT